MYNTFKKYLIINGWKEINSMTFQSIKQPQYEIFFDTSNQIELYLNNERVSEKYILKQLELTEFLKENNFYDLT